MTELVDGRHEQQLDAEMVRRATAVLSADGSAVPPGKIAHAIIGAAARIGEEVTRRLDRVPEKQADNFYAAMGIGRDPARPARVPVAFKLADPAPGEARAPAATRLTAETGDLPAVFEVERGITLAPGSIIAMSAVDLETDRIFLPPPGVVDARLPRVAPILRFLASGAGAGATKLQIDPAEGLGPGRFLKFGSAPDGPERTIVTVEDDLVTIEPPLAATLPKGTPVREVTDFAPFAPGGQDRQSHTLYLSHSTMLEVPAALSFVVAGVEDAAAAEWSWWGKTSEEDLPDWQALEAKPVAGRLHLKKTKGKPEKRDIDGRNGLWLRARLPGGSMRSGEAQDIRLAVSGDDVCNLEHDQRCESQPMAVAYEGIAVTTPIVTNKPYHPFGREPRIFDSFYIGCGEAFGKAGAEVSLCFTLGGAQLGPLAAVGDGPEFQLFGVGSDGLLYQADFTAERPQLKPVPHPRGRDSRVSFLPRAPVAARLGGGNVRVAVADKGAIYLASFRYRAPLVEGSVVWERLTGEPENQDVAISALFIGDDAKASVYALAENRLLVWTREANGIALNVQKQVVDLVPIQGRGIDAALIIDEAEADRRVRVVLADAREVAVATVAPEALPALERAAWAQTIDPKDPELYIAGFEGEPSSAQASQPITLVHIRGGKAEVSRPGECEVLPIAFEPPPLDEPGWSPTLVVATERPTRFVAQQRMAGPATVFRKLLEPASIGAGDEKHRRRMFGAFGKTVIQHADLGLLYRTFREARIDGRTRYVADAARVPAEARYLVFEGAAEGEGFLLLADREGNRLLEPTPRGAELHREASPRFFSDADGKSGDVVVTSEGISLSDSGATGDVDIVLTITDAAGRQEPGGIWHLSRKAGTAEPEWRKPDAFPAPGSGSLQYRLLQPILAAARRAVAPKLALIDYFEPSDSGAVQALLDQGPLQAANAAVAVYELEAFDGVRLFKFPHDLAARDDSRLRLMAASAGWSTLGPADQPANPALSWEYWNGSSWWALDAGTFTDRTANLLLTGGVFFTVPADVRETEVGGRKDRWIRARLVGGDYGEARVTVETHELPGGKSEQEVKRDASAIRAPYVMELKLGYCASELVRPEIVLTADNLGMLDQTSANNAGLPIALFTPVAEYMNRAGTAPAAAADVGACCEELPSRPSIEPAVERDGAAGERLPFSRALLIGFDQPVAGDAISLYFDAAPGRPEVELVAEVFHAGRFDKARILADRSYGFSEPGALALELPTAPERVSLFGTVAHWLRLRPKSDGAAWSPRLRGIYMNAAAAVSVETRSRENLGSSSGAPDQVFHLAQASVAADSLELRVAEPVGIEEAGALQALPEIGGMPGPWLRWQEVPEFPVPDEQDLPQRLYTLDAETGVLRFGNGKNGAIPPPGGAILAVVYRHVTGAAANAVKPGSELQLLSPIAGVEKVIALDAAAGGSDVEAPGAARARAPAKIRNGGRVVTLADVEDFIRSRAPAPAQVHASNWRGGIRLVVAGINRPIPSPAELREIERAVAEVATYGLAAPRRLSAVGPRLLPITIEIVVAPDDATGFADIAAEARRAVGAFFDHATGGHDGRGWPVGARPSAIDVSAPLEPISDRAVVTDVAVARADRDPPQPLPDPLPGDVLVRVEAGSIRVALAGENAA
ncbi:MAG: hypothetical protein ACJ8DM_00575 [Microvirga sp.]